MTFRVKSQIISKDSKFHPNFFFLEIIVWPKNVKVKKYTSRGNRGQSIPQLMFFIRLLSLLC